MSIINTIRSIFNKPVVASVVYVNTFTYEAVAVTGYGDNDGHYEKMELNMPVIGFSMRTSISKFDNVLSAAKQAREFSVCGTQYAVVNNGVIIALFYNGVCISNNM